MWFSCLPRKKKTGLRQCWNLQRTGSGLIVIESDLKNKYSNEVLNNITNESESDQSMQEETARLILQ